MITIIITAIYSWVIVRPPREDHSYIYIYLYLYTNKLLLLLFFILVFLLIITMSVIVQVTTTIFTLQKCIVVSLLRKSALKLVVIGSIANLHIKTIVGVKIVKRIEPWRNNANRQQHFDRKISPSTHHHLCREKKKREKEKWKGNRNAVLSYLLKIYKDHNAADSEMKIVLSPRRKEKY